MKVRINLTTEDNLLNKIKRYASNKQMSDLNWLRAISRV